MLLVLVIRLVVTVSIGTTITTTRTIVMKNASFLKFLSDH